MSEPTRGTSRSWPCPHPADFAILVVHTRADVVLQLSGALTYEGSDAFDKCVEWVLADAPRRLVLEASALLALDRSGVASFFKASRRAETASVELVLDSPNELVSTLLEAAGIRDAFVVRPRAR